MDLRGSSAIVTGGASGLGAAAVRLLGERGLRVVVADLASQQERAHSLVEGTGGAFAPTDVTDTEQVVAAVEMAKDLGPLKGAGQLRRHCLGQPDDRQGRPVRLGP